MKYIYLLISFLIPIICTSCGGQNQKSISTNNSRSEIKDSITFKIPNSMVRNITQAKNGDMLIASYKGVYRYNGTSFTNITSKINSPSFWDVLEDRKRNLWLATRDSGVYYYNGISFQHFTTKEGLANNRVGKIFEDIAGNIWFATGGGASRYDGNSFRNFTTKEGLSNNDLTTIMEDKTGKLWFGTRGAACFYDGKTFNIFRSKDGKSFDNVWSIIEDKKGNIWFGNNDGLWRFDGSTSTKLSPRGAYAVIEDKEGNIWTTGSVNSSGITTWALSRYDHNSLYDNKPNVTEIMMIKGTGALCGVMEAEDGSIWFGALGPESGVYRYNGKTITNFMSK